MRDWLKYFRIWFLVCGIILVIIMVYYIANKVKMAAQNEDGERINTVCTETERVFDFADVLTDSEEDALRELISKTELETCCDIILVVMNESLEEYAKGYFPDAYGSDWAMIKADNFYDENGFGWNKHKEADDGDGVLLLDNWYRESDGRVHTWLSTSGKVEYRFGDAQLDAVLDAVYAYDIEQEPYKAYRAYVETFGRVMRGGTSDSSSDVAIPWYGIFLGPLLVAVIFVVCNMSGKEGKKTVKVDTYVGGVGHPVYKVKEDRFLRRSVTKRHIDRSSGGGGGGRSGGGGGHHTSSGGHSHGGGGRSR